MAKYTNRFTVKSVLKLSSKDISKMSDRELRKAVTIMNSAANKRIKRVYNKGLSSGKIDRQLENGKFSVKGIESRAALENALMDVRGFMETKTTTVSGIRSAQKKMFKKLAKEVNRELPPSERISVSGKSDKDLQDLTGLIWSQVDKISENKSLGITKRERYRLAAHAYNVTSRKSRPIKTKRGLFRNLQNYYNKMYQESIEDKELSNMTAGESEVASIYTNIT